jgi:hypothetical protein
MPTRRFVTTVGTTMLSLSPAFSLSLSPYLLSLAFSSISLSTHTPAALVIFTKDGQLELEDFYDFGEDDEGWEDVDDTGESTGDGSAAGASKALMIQSDSTKAKGDYELDLFRGAKKPTTVDVRHPTLSCARKPWWFCVYAHITHTHRGGFPRRDRPSKLCCHRGHVWGTAR